MDKPLVLAGIPRVGSTWVAKVLGCCGPRLVNEPDNEVIRPEATRAKLGLGRHPVLAAGDDAPRYAQLWSAALTGGHVAEGWRRRTAHRLLRSTPREQLDRAFAPPGPVSPRLRLVTMLTPGLGAGREDPVLVKSVHAALALEWLASRFTVRIVAVVRSRLDVLASWLELGLSPPRLLIPREVAEQIAAWLPDDRKTAPIVWTAVNVTVLLEALEWAAARNDWLLVRHEELCRDPHASFQRLAEQLGLEWHEAATRFLEDSHRPGEGYETARIASRTVGSWRRRLTDRQAAVAQETITRVRGGG